jgi:hypothetical protein
MTEKPIFGKHQLVSGKHILLHTGDFYLGAKRENDGWLLLQFNDSEWNETKTPDFSQADYYLSGKSNKLIISPALPYKPLVFKGARLHVSPGQRLNFYVKIPLTFQIYYSKTEPENLLKEFPVKRLSDTWFGEAFNGEPAFALDSEFFFSMEEIACSASEVICPISIFNNSPGLLEVERLIIRVENLALYRNEQKLISSQVVIEYKGKETISSASYRFSKYIHGEKAEMVTKPRATASKNLLKINFHFIKNLYKTEE